MSDHPLLYLLIGLLFGTTLLALGIAIGFWMSKRVNQNQPSMDQQQFIAALRNMASWTNDFAGDFTRYQSTMESLKRDVDDKRVRTKEEVQKLLDRIVDANSVLQARLDSAEQKLELQTKQLAGYLTEARTDSLTGLANRKAFDQKLDECFVKWNQGKQAFSLTLIDIDHFKHVNDTYGHPAGDAVLREMAMRLQEISGESILIARYGGEEFAILTEGELHRAAPLIERLRLLVSVKPFNAEGYTIPITLSAGTAHVVGGDKIGKLVRRADEALYSAKSGGRNRIYLHNGVLCEPYGDPTASSSHGSLQDSAYHETTPTVDELEHRILMRLDKLIAPETQPKS